METAVPSQAVLRTFKKIQEVQTEEQKSVTEDGKITGLLGDDRWTAFQEEITRRIAVLSAMNGVEPTDTVESIGFRFLAVSLAVTQLKWVLDLPQTLYEAQQHGSRTTKADKPE